MSHWNAHPHVRTGEQLSFGERAADALKLCFGTWSLLFGIIIAICLWMTLVSDPGELHLNLALSFLASVQGVILQIAANRGDRIASEVALGTHGMAAELIDLNKTQLEILTELRGLRAELGQPETESEA